MITLLQRLARLALLLLTLPILSTAISDLGINCEGNWIYCWAANRDIIPRLLTLVEFIQPRDIYTLDSNIICFPHTHRWFENLLPDAAGFCLFFQGSDIESNIILNPYGQAIRGVNGSQIQEGVRRLMDHGCRTCGSVPVAFELNDPHRRGILTVNWVGNREHCADEKSGTNICQPAYAANSDFNPYNQWDNWRKPTSRPAAVVTPAPRPTTIVTSRLPIGFFTIPSGGVPGGVPSKPDIGSNNTSSADDEPQKANSNATITSARPLGENSTLSRNNTLRGECAAAIGNGTMGSDQCDDGSGGDPPTQSLPLSAKPSGVDSVVASPRPINDLDASTTLNADSSVPT